MGEFAEKVRAELREKLETARQLNEGYKARIARRKSPEAYGYIDRVLDDLRLYGQVQPRKDGEQPGQGGDPQGRS